MYKIDFRNNPDYCSDFQKSKSGHISQIHVKCLSRNVYDYNNRRHFGIIGLFQSALWLANFKS